MSIFMSLTDQNLKTKVIIIRILSFSIRMEMSLSIFYSIFQYTLTSDGSLLMKIMNDKLRVEECR